MTHPVAAALKHRRPWLARVTLVVVLAGFVALAARVALSIGAPDLLEQKITNAERYIYYRLDAKTGPRFELAPEDKAIRLVTHVVLPPATFDPRSTPFDSTREVEYGVRVHVDLDDGKAWTRDIYTRSRQSKARWTGSMWLDENVFVPGSKLQLTDDRLLVVSLPTKLRTNATLKVTLLGDVAEGYVRAYAPQPRDAIDRRVRDLPDADRARIAAQLGHLPWDRIAEPDELAALRFTERRLSAEGKEGIDYVTRTLFTTGFRLRTESRIERGLLVTAQRGAAINVVGPAKIDMTVSRAWPTMGGAPPPAVGSVEISLVGETPGPAPLTVQLPPLGTRVTPAIEVPTGLFTLTVTTTAPARLELSSMAPTAVALGGTPGSALLPDEQIATAFVADEAAPVDIAIDGPPDLLSRVLRIDVRALTSTPVTPDMPAPAIAPGTAGIITLETLDEEGTIIAATTAPFECVTSKFEIVKLPGKLAASVCEPASLRFVAPSGGRTVRIHADKPAIVQAQTPIAIAPPADRLEPPYDSVVLTTMKWRYARFIDRGWLALRPRSIAPDRIALLASQARLELREVPPESELRGTSLVTPGSRQTVIERVAAEDVAEFIAEWDVGRYTRVRPDKPIKLDMGRLPTRAQVRYRADDSVGASAKVTIDSKVEDDTLSAARGTLKLPDVGDGVHTLRVDTDSRVELLVDRPPAPGQAAELYALRTISPVDKRLRVTVQKKTAAQQNVNIILYTSSTASTATAHITIDGGSPARISGTPLAMWTLADRTVPLPPADRPPTLGFADAQGGKLYPRRLVVALGDDLPAGTHTLEISVSERAWARLFTLDDAPVAPRARQWRESVEESP